ncbi:MAG: phosphoadenylyl-sulfate reductase [Deltaproteobacteria bacterium]|nr:phosphoadenylyl-sulfate reductase [Deltaproteobacteria bacterium]
MDLDEINGHLGGCGAEERIRWTVDHYGEGAVLLSSMQKTSSVLAHMFHALGLDNEILFVDTGYHFHETLALRDEFMRRYGLNVVTLYPERTPEEQEEHFGCKLYRSPDGQPRCCDVRKTRPFLEHLRVRNRTAVIGGLRRGEGGARGRLPVVGLDARTGGVRVHPLVDWSSAQVGEYLAAHGVPVHPLHGRCYPSIGCQCCTTPVAPGEDARAGRWRHLREGDAAGPIYCGINDSDGSGI